MRRSDVIYLLVVLEVRPLLAARVFAGAASSSSSALAVSVEAAGCRLTGRRWAERRLGHPGKLPDRHIQKRRGGKSRREKRKREKKRKREGQKGREKETAEENTKGKRKE